MSSHSRIVPASDPSRDSTAFLGAIHAFSPPKTPVQPGRGAWNGALAAAIFAGDGKQRQARTADQEKSLPGKTRPLVVRKVPAMSFGLKQTSETFLEESPQQGVVATRGRSPSRIAARQAASKSSGTFNASISPNRLSERFSHSQSISTSSLSKDESPILVTKALVKLFESHANVTPSSSRVSSPRQTQAFVRNASPNPIAPFDGEKYEPWRSKPTEESSAKKRVPDPPSTEPISHLTLSSYKTKPEDFSKLFATRTERPQPDSIPKRIAPTPPPPHRARRDGGPTHSNRTELAFTNNPDENSSPSSYASAVDMIQPSSSSIEPNPTSKSIMNQMSRSVLEQRRATSASHPEETTGRSERIDYSPSAAKNRQGREGLLVPHSLTPQLTADSLADAMVASSLASSRAASPSKQAPPLPRRHSKQLIIFRRSQSHDLSKSRTPSPGKGGMRQTMRAPSKVDDDDVVDYNRKRNGYILNKHPNKHHEGDRKRWRIEITEQERKRYEGVWAANKGLWMPPGDSELATKVVNLVVRDIWCRSKLPDHVLEEVWDLVDREGLGRLGKEEFVVGMWLIDQRLKGRKLPVKVSESVWFSAQRLTGVKSSKFQKK